MNSKCVGVFADFHCGHVVGLTHPDYQLVPVGSGGKFDRLVQVQSSLWSWFADKVKSYGHFDIAIMNGDLTDGKGNKSGGTEQITTSMQRQCEMARDVVKFINADEVVMTYGTPYHVNGSDGEDWESLIWPEAKRVESHGFYDIDGVIFDVKHKVGSSAIPHGIFTAPAREKLWNELWALDDGQPRANVIIRSHVHYFSFCGDSNCTVFTTPALQGPGSKFGARQCSRKVDFGFMVFKVYPDGTYTWKAEVLPCRVQAAKVLKL